MAPRDPLAALAWLLRTSPSQPLLTFHDGTSGGRVELSTLTVDNWVSKVANLFAADLAQPSGVTFAVELPTHWQTAVTVLGGWAAGLTLTAPDGQVSLRVVGPAAVDVGAGAGPAAEVVATALHPLGGRFQRPLPAGWRDFAAEVPPQPDVLMEPRAPADPVVTISGPRSARSLMRDAGDAAATIGLEPGGRLMTDLNPASEDGLVRALCACLVVGASLVLVADIDAADADRLAEQERVTCSAWAST